MLIGKNKKHEMINMNHNYSEDTVMVRFSHLTRRFGNFTAVSDLTFDIHQGEVVGILGPNGAGKSTTMKMMAYLIRPSTGEILIRNNGRLERLDNSTKDILLDKFGFLIENPAFYEDVTPRQILGYFAELRGYPSKLVKQRVEEVVAMMGMQDWIDKKISTFSKGMRQKIGIISTIVHDPQVIVLDEPQTGLDPKARIEVRKFILTLKEMGKTIFLSSHQLYEIGEVADRIAIINHGQLVAFDSMDKLEAKAKKSIIQLEIYPPPKSNIKEMCVKLQDLLTPFTGLELSKNYVKYNSNNEYFEIMFDGKPESQIQIFKALAKEEYGVIGFSVPRAGLLEDLYLSLVETKEEAIV
jgi:ABC-type multidrug transport system ATPase subunit